MAGPALCTPGLTHQRPVQGEGLNLWIRMSNLGQRHTFGTQYSKDEAIIGGERTTQKEWEVIKDDSTRNS